MRLQHHPRSGTSYVKSFLLLGTLTASQLFTSPALHASEIRSFSDCNVKFTSTSTSQDTPGRFSQLFSDIKQYLGIRYRFGGTTPSGFDCSGFVRFMFGKVFDMQLPRSSREMSNIGMRVDRSELRPGDLVFFHNAGKRINHVGIFVGEGKFVHSSLSKGITWDRLNENYYDRNFATGVRVLDISDQKMQQEIDRIARENESNSSPS
ncbi:MAG: NlpC/P60 family protein [Chlorobiaceae bacterium]|nr:NlpC/P60 family protein [Chlorobiaceae bacterium]